MPALGIAPSLFILIGWIPALWGFQHGLPLAMMPLVSVLASCGAVFLAVDRVVPNFWRIFAALLIFSAAGSLFLGFRLSTSPPGKFPFFIRDRGMVVMERPWQGKRATIIATPHGKILVKSGPLGIKEGQIVEASGIVLDLEKETDLKSHFNEAVYWKARAVAGELLDGSIKLIRGERSLSIHSWRTWLRQRILLSCPPRVRGYLLASWLGVRDPELRHQHSRWGTSHLLAVSGFHVGLLLVLLYRFFRSRKCSIPVISLFLWIYVFFAGASASALRAALMIQIVLLGWLLGRPTSSMNSAALGGMILLFLCPWWFWDVGWRLSVLAVVTLSAVVDKWNGKYSILLISPLIWLATAACVSWTFDEAPLCGIVLNLLAIPVFSLLLPLLSILALPPILGGSVVAWIAAPAEFLCYGWEVLADTIYSILPFTISWSHWLDAISMFVIIIVIGWRLEIPWRKNFLATGIFLVICLWVWKGVPA